MPSSSENMIKTMQGTSKQFDPVRGCNLINAFKYEFEKSRSEISREPAHLLHSHGVTPGSSALLRAQC